MSLARSTGISRSTIARLETGRMPELGASALRRLLQAVGQDLRVTTFNRGRPTLDELAQQRTGTAPTERSA
jgi:transcriptional regulator with XRE-family HTH domain